MGQGVIPRSIEHRGYEAAKGLSGHDRAIGRTRRGTSRWSPAKRIEVQRHIGWWVAQELGAVTQPDDRDVVRGHRVIGDPRARHVDDLSGEERHPPGRREPISVREDAGRHGQLGRRLLADQQGTLAPLRRDGGEEVLGGADRGCGGDLIVAWCDDRRVPHQLAPEML